MEFINDKERKGQPKIDAPQLILKKVDPIWLYGLLKTKISPIKPNGFYTFLQLESETEPIGHLIWWDYILESEIGFIHIWRRRSHIEFMYQVEDKDFDIIKFLNKNIGIYKDEILNTLNNLETHTLYINHYVSYKNCTDFLFKEVNIIDITKPNIAQAHKENRVQETIGKFLENSIKYHALGKSHILNCAFMAESFLNLYIRVTMRHDAKVFPDIEKRFLNCTFLEKLKSLQFYSVLLENPINIDEPIIQDVLNLMKLRNKYVHFDASSEVNRLGEVKFDEMFPVFPNYANGTIVQSIERGYHIPYKAEIRKADQTSKKFVEYLFSLTTETYRKRLTFLMNQNPIGYNERKKIYSAIFENIEYDMYPSFDEEDSFDIDVVAHEKPNQESTGQN